MLTVEKALHGWGQRAYGKSLYFLLSFTVNLNVLLKSSLSKIKNFVENTYEKTNSVTQYRKKNI